MKLDKINIIVADDHPMLRSGVIAHLKKKSFVNKVFEAENGQIALDIIKVHQPDLLFTDISMPELDGIELIEIVKKSFPRIKTVAFTQFSDIQIIKSLLRLHTDAILLKAQDINDIEKAIKVVFKNENYYAQEINNVIINSLQKKKKSSNDIIIELTKRENQILELISEEKTNKEISDELFISIPTVETYRRNLFQKFNVRNSAGLMRKAMQLGFIS